MCDRDKRSCGCSCEVRGFIQPRLLLLLAQKEAHGYELMESLRATAGAERLSDPGMLYRALRQLEEQAVVRSAWRTGGAGPARRVYELTPVGHELLEAWAAEIRKTRAHLDEFLAEYEALVGRSRAKKRKKG